jgi:hypothetical protein
MTDRQKSFHLPLRWKRVWFHGFVLGLGFVLICFLAWSFLGGTSPPPAPPKGKQAPPAQAHPGPSPPAGPLVASMVPGESTATLKSQLEQVLSGIKEANQQKDLSQLLSHYSPNFLLLPQRAQSISKSWKIYNFPKMEFDIKEVRFLDDHTAIARVTWDVEVQNISTLKNKNISKTYLIRFVKESEQWRIKALDQAE